ncbi:Dolichyl-diphosphooligosaccharide-protein glycosyltransferase subunit dad1 [Malassezia caprae]|uniref:DASH complex subunit DAD1 n=1 Tax=Malassezia caprae TaxID=1381934 RepID=A0AAF0E326_9BASI|nr:Dolichyl-diphosphooligosaccharide-protein glycosyltransferase subunit dad1 [Malassezia caprae]
MTTVPTTQDTDAASFFERERDKLIADITSDLETIIASSNAVNRKMEEQISVGKGFDSISELWGQLSELMAQAGLPAESAEETRADA